MAFVTAKDGAAANEDVKQLRQAVHYLLDDPDKNGWTGGRHLLSRAKYWETDAALWVAVDNAIKPHMWRFSKDNKASCSVLASLIPVDSNAAPIDQLVHYAAEYGGMYWGDEPSNDEHLAEHLVPFAVHNKDLQALCRQHPAINTVVSIIIVARNMCHRDKGWITNAKNVPVRPKAGQPYVLNMTEHKSEHPIDHQHGSSAVRTGPSQWGGLIQRIASASGVQEDKKRV